jgi:CarD family transcriptional regulator
LLVSYIPGQILVHPFHGPAVITRLMTRTVKAREVEYLELLPLITPIVLSAPVDNVGSIGLREVIDEEAADRLLTLLADDLLPRETSWSRRLKDYQLRMQTGSLDDRAIVYREIRRRADNRSVSDVEKTLMRAALEALSVELGLSLNTTTEKAVALIEAAAVQRNAPRAAVLITA